MKKAVLFRLRLLFLYFKSTILVNFAVSAFFAVVAYSSGFAYQLFAVSFCTAGPVLAILYKEMAAQKEYYFYYNLGISKVQLIGQFMLIDLLISLLICLIAIA